MVSAGLALPAALADGEPLSVAGALLAAMGDGAPLLVVVFETDGDAVEELLPRALREAELDAVKEPLAEALAQGAEEGVAQTEGCALAVESALKECASLAVAGMVIVAPGLSAPLALALLGLERLGSAVMVEQRVRDPYAEAVAWALEVVEPLAAALKLSLSVPRELLDHAPLADALAVARAFTLGSELPLTAAVAPLKDGVALLLENTVAPLKDGVALLLVVMVAPLEEGVLLRVRAAEALPLPLPAAREALFAALRELRAVEVADAEAEAESAGEAELDATPLTDALALPLGLGAMVPLADAQADALSVEDTLSEALALAVKLPAEEGVRGEEAVCTALPLAVADATLLAVRAPLLLIRGGETDAVEQPLVEVRALNEGEPEDECVRIPVSDTQGEADPEGLPVPLPDAVCAPDAEALPLNAPDEVAAALPLDVAAPLPLAALEKEDSAEAVSAAVVEMEASALLLPSAVPHAEEEAVEEGTPTDVVPLAVGAPVEEVLPEAVREALCVKESEEESEACNDDAVAPAVAGALANAEELPLPAPPLTEEDAVAEAQKVALDPLLAVGAPV